MRVWKSWAPDEVSLREIARKVGVSATAVYRHFPDKASLMGALCHVGGDQLADAFRSAMAGAKSGREAFEAMGLAYVRFALKHPSLFRMMMTYSPEGEAPPWENRLSMLTEALKGVLPDDVTEDERRVRRLQAWAIVHGLAMLVLDGQVPPDDELIQRAVKTFAA
jgi:AcrR family transcriptional regulator